jgi:hypothetical protein
MVLAGVVYSTENGKVRVRTHSPLEIAMPLLTVPDYMTVSVGDNVAFVVFDDGTGAVLAVI